MKIVQVLRGNQGQPLFIKALEAADGKAFRGVIFYLVGLFAPS